MNRFFPSSEAPWKPVPCITGRETPPQAKGIRRKATDSCGTGRGTGVCQGSRRRPISWVTHRFAGAVGIDTNEGHLTLAETDCFDKGVRIPGIRFNLHGKSDEQAKAIFGDACKGGDPRLC
ncbi:hypothetical protein MPNT_200041 [Candidatus Methylacidithermus pantelleriae]|uniref:Uncharacterized protein n=1 Tax=Candidatus Methylacidithermus pantelleriae TaxID=2744239 RepID=A0A8J2FS83_9BACT|nr:hypothetical protein MPNT_200041 [Candidatus Methylacidithermus pantelleriae]